MESDSDPVNADEQATTDKVGLIGGVAELAGHVFGVVARIFVR